MKIKILLSCILLFFATNGFCAWSTKHNPNAFFYNRRPVACHVEKVRVQKVCHARKAKTDIQIKAGRGSSNKIVSVARHDIGVKEGSKRANQIAQKCGLRSSVGKRNAWCAATVSDWLVSSDYKIERTPSVRKLRGTLSSNGWRRTSRPIVGAVAFHKDRSHVGIVAKVDGRSVMTIEGNSQNQVKVNEFPAHALEYWYKS